MKHPCKNDGCCKDVTKAPGYKCTCPPLLKRVRESDCAYDIAMNKDADQSSDYMGHKYLEVARYAVDGDQGTLSKTLDLGEQWWRVDFGETMQFDEVTVVLANADTPRRRLEKGKVLVSNAYDFQNHTLCHEFPSGGLPKAYSFRCRDNPTTARYLKIVPGQSGSLVLFDVLVYGWSL